MALKDVERTANQYGDVPRFGPVNTARDRAGEGGDIELLPAGGERLDGGERLRFARTDDCDGVDTPSRLRGGGGDARTHLAQPFSQILRTY